MRSSRLTDGDAAARRGRPRGTACWRRLLPATAPASPLTVAAPLDAGVSPEQVAADLAANRTAGFFDPGCPGYTDVARTSPGGPTVVSPLYLSSQNPSISAPTILPPEGLAVDERGVVTIYVYAGFRS